MVKDNGNKGSKSVEKRTPLGEGNSGTIDQN